MFWLTLLTVSVARAADGPRYEGPPNGIFTQGDASVAAFIAAKNAEADAWIGGDPGADWRAGVPPWTADPGLPAIPHASVDLSRLEPGSEAPRSLPGRVNRAAWLDPQLPAGFLARGSAAGVPWLDGRRVAGAAGREAVWTGVGAGGALLLVIEPDGASRLLGIDPRHPAIDPAELVLGSGAEAPVVDARPLGDALLLIRWVDGLAVLERVIPHTGARERTSIRATGGLAFGPRRGDKYTILSYGIEGERAWEVGAEGEPVPTGPGRPVKVETLLAPAGDTTVPITLVEPAGVEIAPDAPLLVHVYGGFGRFTSVDDAGINQAWLRAGGRVAAVHPRGGGERGPTWHAAGRGADKLQTVIDTVTAVAFLQASGRGTPERTALWGESNGGLIAAAAAARAPDRFGAVVAGVGPYDLVEAAGLATFEERRALPAGSILPRPDHPEAWWNGPEYPAAPSAAARALSPVYTVPEKLPPILLFTGASDQVVNPVHSVRLAAAWDEIPGGPVLLQVHPTSTHGPPPGSCWFGWSSSQGAITADALSFVVRALGLAGPDPAS